jgi:NADPH-dependent 2,4-dienoyl-CoA reductase/sulfur reductase-like enzyme
VRPRHRRADDGRRDEVAILSPGYREEPLWSEGVVGPAVAVAELPARADAVIVGAGYCGTSAAWELARRGMHVVVVEAGSAGSGASGRTGAWSGRRYYITAGETGCASGC